MKRNTKIALVTVAVIGISAATVGMVSAGGRWGDCGYYGYGAGPMGQGFQQQPMGPGFNRGGPMMHKRMSFDDRTQRMGEHLAMLKQNLNITPDQEAVWSEFESSMKDKMATRQQGKRILGAGSEMSIPDRAAMMRSKADQLKQTADAMDKLYAALTPEQQAIADQHRPMGMRRGF